MVTTALANRLPRLVAPWWHTAALVLVIVSVAVVGSLSSPGLPPSSRIAAVYVPTIIVQIALVYWVSRAFRSRSVLRELVGRAVLLDVPIALALAALVIAVELVFGSANGSALTILPRTGPERLVWILLAVSVGFAEELVYRGYLVVQLRAFTRSTAAAVVLQALLFAIAHANQGAGAMLRFACYALVFGVVAVRRGSLVPTILCHVAIDALAAFKT
ncbi:MAG TPA: CPBP family intramembrane glutamic endopeptidase [Polyangiaceae bacterium]|jgi:membrane protease YdiL (CAAX protease family)